MGMYDAIIDKLPKSLGTDAKTQEKVNAVKEKILEAETENPLTIDGIEDILIEITALQKVLNDALIQSVGKDRSAVRFAGIMRNLRVVKAAYDEQEKILNTLIEAYKQFLVTQYEAEGSKSVTLDSGAKIRTQPEPHATVTDYVAVRKWAIKEGLEDSLTIPWPKLNALTKAALLAGEEPPDGVEAESWTKVVYTKA